MNLRPPIIYSNADFHGMCHTNYFKRTNKAHLHAHAHTRTVTVLSFVVGSTTAIECWIENDYFFCEYFISIFGQSKKKSLRT